ncbi:phage integrase family protein [Burkholderia ambifaria]|uniref:phage integrase family protein n=1 Tax=Burkholderia ambifaria TaxID=152480 RepID=UPI001FC7DCBA|nr:phage integrase family protein [Burkholderia ambifaria]
MEASLVEAPQLERTLDGWFDARLVARLEAAGITTFAKLLAHLRERSSASGAIRRRAATFYCVFDEGADRGLRFSCALS